MNQAEIIRQSKIRLDNIKTISNLKDDVTNQYNDIQTDMEAAIVKEYNHLDKIRQQCDHNFGDTTNSFLGIGICAFCGESNL